jgi:hypothetical protein
MRSLLSSYTLYVPLTVLGKENEYLQISLLEYGKGKYIRGEGRESEELGQFLT